MFGFGKKLTMEEKQQWDNELKSLLEKEDYLTAYKKAKEYEKLDKASASFFLALMYYKGQGVKSQDLDKALNYIVRYTEKYPEDADGWFYGSDIMVANNKPEDAIEYLVRAEKLGKEAATKCLANLCSYMGLAYRNAAWITLKVTEYRELNAKAILCFTRAIQKYHKMFEKNPSDLKELEWMQLGYVVHYMHYLALSGAWPNILYKEETIGDYLATAYQMSDRAKRERTAEYWKELAEKVISDMENVGYKVQATYTKAMLVNTEADLNKSTELLVLAKQYLDQACELAGDQAEKYKSEYEDVWKEYERLVRIADKDGEKNTGFFQRRINK